MVCAGFVDELTELDDSAGEPIGRAQRAPSEVRGPWMARVNLGLSDNFEVSAS